MIQATEVSITYRGDGETTTFSYPYPYRIGGDIHGYLVDTVGNETEITTNYQFDTVENKYTYPVAGDAIDADTRIKITRETPLQNNIDLPDRLPFSLIEKGMDWIIMMLQETIYRANLAPISAQEATKQAALAMTYAYEALDHMQKAAAEHAAATEEANKATAQANIATNRAEQAGNYSATSFAATAPAWNESTTYSYPTVVAYTDGNTYRCIGTDVAGGTPTDSTNWVKITLDGENFFEIDETGNLMPCISPTYSSRWELDENGDIMLREIVS